jgi:hypothetical protein
LLHELVSKPGDFTMRSEFRRTLVSVRAPAAGLGAAGALDSLEAGFDSLGLGSSLGFRAVSAVGWTLSEGAGADSSGSFLSTCWSLGSDASLVSAAGLDSSLGAVAD